MSEVRIDIPAGAKRRLMTGGKYCPDNILVAAQLPQAEEKDVNFYDYDGTLLYSYTLAEAQALEELPPLPERDGLVCQGWNWTLEEVRAVDRPSIIGPNYDTPDGSVKIHIDTVIDGLDVTLLNYQASANDNQIDWGDGSAVETYGASGNYTLTHTYVNGGKYIISVFSAAGSLALGNNSSAIVDKDIVEEINFGSQTKSFASYICNGLKRLKRVSFSENAVALNASYLFQSTEQMEFLALPRLAASSGTYFMRFASGILGVAAPPNFRHGTAAFCDCYRLRFAPLPDGQATTASQFCRSARCLNAVYFPAGVATIAATAFQNCSNVLLFDFTRHSSVPTLENVSAFTGINAECEFRVPASLRDEWAAETNWATYASQIVGGVT